MTAEEERVLEPNPLRTRADWRRAAREDAAAALEETLARSTYPDPSAVPAVSAGRDLTAQDVREAICETHEYGRIADRLNAIARPDGTAS